MDIPQHSQTIHFVGIKGVAMTALAVYCRQKGIHVTGSDTTEEFPTSETLLHEGITPLEGFLESHIDTGSKPDLVIYTGAHNGRDNVEVKKALACGIRVMPHGEALGMFMENTVQISVAGSHGKTTTSAIIATILSSAGVDPSYAIGCGDIKGLGASGHFGHGLAFVAEADEYITDPNHDIKPRFLWQHPHILVVTNIDFDHPDAYDTLDDVKKAFMTLQKQQIGVRTTIVNADDPESLDLLKNTENTILTFGKTEAQTLWYKNIVYGDGFTSFDLNYNGMVVDTYTIHVPGEHNVANAAAAALATHLMGISWDAIKVGLAKFLGTKRRFERIGEKNGAVIIDDYAHHPKEIAATLAGARLYYPNHKIITVFQPHTYSRTKSLLPEFSTCFTDSDVVVVADIYGSARETDTEGITSAALVEGISKFKHTVYYQKNFPLIKTFLDKILKSGDIVIFMGAGDIYGWSRRYVSLK